MSAASERRLLIAQKRLMRLIFSMRSRDSCRPTFVANGILTFPSIYIYKCSVYVFDNKNRFRRNGDNHSYGTRGRSNYRIPLHHTTGFQHGPAYSCAVIYNKIPAAIRSCNTKAIFKKKLRTYLAQECFYSIKDFFNV